MMLMPSISYRQSMAASSGRAAASRIAWCESNISALATIVTNPRATAGLQAAMARRANISGAAAPPSAADASPREDA